MNFKKDDLLLLNNIKCNEIEFDKCKTNHLLFKCGMLAYSKSGSMVISNCSIDTLSYVELSLYKGDCIYFKNTNGCSNPPFSCYLVKKLKIDLSRIVEYLPFMDNQNNYVLKMLKHASKFKGDSLHINVTKLYNHIGSFYIEAILNCSVGKLILSGLNTEDSDKIKLLHKFKGYALIVNRSETDYPNDGKLYWDKLIFDRHYGGFCSILNQFILIKELSNITSEYYYE
jgi:hypothetical protein